MKTLIFLLLLLFAYGNCIAQNAQNDRPETEIAMDDAASTCQISGIVKNINTNKPIAGVSILMFPSKGTNQQATVTDANGMYSFEIKQESNYTLYFTKDSYFTQTKSVSSKDRDCLDAEMKKYFEINVNLAKK